VHEFVIVQTDLAASQLPVDANGDVDEGQVTVVDEVEDLEPAAAQDLSVNLAAGHYVLMCNEPGHYKQGMYLDFTFSSCESRTWEGGSQPSSRFTSEQSNSFCRHTPGTWAEAPACCAEETT
jgi:hypothetical protein